METPNNPLFSLFQMSSLIQNFNKRTEKKLGLSLVQWCLLRQLIDMPGTSAHSLAKAVGVHPSSLTQTLKRLEKRKYILIISDPMDSRRKLISITRIGKNLLEDIEPYIRSCSNDLFPVSKELMGLCHFLSNKSFGKETSSSADFL